MNHRHLNEKFLRLTFLEHFRTVVPLTALQVKAVKVAARLRLLFDILVRHRTHHDMSEADLIDSDCMLSREVLLSASEESLREEESRDPEYDWCSIVIPVLQEFDTIITVLDP